MQRKRVVSTQQKRVVSTQQKEAASIQQKKTSKKKQNKYAEFAHQKAFVKWFRLSNPELSDLLTIASFGENIGARRMSELKMMGLVAGYPDLKLSVPVGAYHSLYIEMKSQSGVLSAGQKRVHGKLIEMGFKVETCRSWADAKDAVTNYLENKVD